MFTNPLVSGLFVVVAIAVFIILCYKNVHTGIAAIIAAIIAAFGSTNAFYVSLFEVFPSGVASLVSMMFWVFTVSGLLGFLMDETGWNDMLANAAAEEYYQCDVEIGGTTFYRVAIRPKGNTSLTSIASDPTTDRYSFKLEFDQRKGGSR